MPFAPNQKADFRRQGFVKLGRILEAQEAGRLKAAFLENVARDSAQSVYGILRHNVWRRVPEFAELVRGGELAARMRDLLEIPEIVLFQDNLICKPPGTAAAIEWHQDYAYWPLGAPAGVTLWIALDEATSENGCLKYVPGTHQEGECCPTDFVSGAGQPALAGLPPLVGPARAHEAVELPLLPGEAVAHHPLTWHCSLGNRTSSFRTGYSLTWIEPWVAWSPSHAPHPYNYELHPAAGSPVCGSLFPRFGEGANLSHRQ